jgi:hypothetical protein
MRDAMEEFVHRLRLTLQNLKKGALMFDKETGDAQTPIVCGASHTNVRQSRKWQQRDRIAAIEQGQHGVPPIFTYENGEETGMW